MGISGLKDLTLKVGRWVLVLLFTFLIQASVVFEAMAADTTIKGTATDSTASLEVTNSNSATLLYVGNDGKVGIGLTAPKTQLTVEGALTLKERAEADDDVAAYGQVWVKTATPNTLWFTDDADTDTQLGASAAHTVASHSDTTGTGAELDELTNGSETTLHSHASSRGLSAYTNEDSDSQTLVKDHAYLAMTDGMVFAHGDISASALFKVYVGLTNDPAGAGLLIQQVEPGSTRQRSICALVAEGEYFEITGVSGALTAYWKSFGTLSKPVDQD